MKSFAIIALLVITATATQADSFLESPEYKKVLNSKWGRIVVELAEMNAVAEGPIEDLKQAIAHLRDDA